MLKNIIPNYIMFIVVVIVFVFYLDNSAANLIITKALPNPAGNDDAMMPYGEWIEIWNNGSEVMNYEDYEGYFLTDTYDEHILTISKENIMFTGKYAIIYRNGDRDFSLNNKGDVIRLWHNSEVIDEFSYKSVKEEEVVQRFSNGEADFYGYEYGENDEKNDNNIENDSDDNKNNDEYNKKDEIKEEQIASKTNGNNKNDAYIKIFVIGNTSFGSFTKILLSAYRNETGKYAIKLKVIGIGFEETYYIKEKNKVVNFSSDIFIECPDDLVSYGAFEVVASGLGVETKAMLIVDGINSSCMVNEYLTNEKNEKYNQNQYKENSVSKINIYKIIASLLGLGLAALLFIKRGFKDDVYRDKRFIEQNKPANKGIIGRYGKYKDKSKNYSGSYWKPKRTC